ncbi:MAG: hypothetical protein GW823_12415 [Bacteroidetes bacterium]|nr:hypothetical protein [Bacteroidota bacterium]
MFKKILFIVINLFLVDFAMAQGGGFPVNPNAIGAPIDGGLSLLLAAGAAYGAKKVYDFRKKDNQDDETLL